jgi:large subunit ribosomal protein L9
MKIILLKDIKNLGSFSSKITIKSGFGRNYLLKKNKAIRATPQNKFFFFTGRTEN